ncbi:MAG: glycosyltransferase family 2 protein [Candidatus Dormibacteria bacterium]
MSGRAPASIAAMDACSPAASLPTVSVIVPVLNEERHLDACLAAIAGQTYPAIAEILVADGGSADRTRQIAESYPLVKVLENPDRIQATGLNAALAEAVGDLVVRVDGHCVLPPDYVERCVESLGRSGAAMVGGAMVPAPGGGWVGRAIAAAMGSRLGAGPARFHIGGAPGWVDTVYLGCYPAKLARRIGGYRLDVGVNEDAELALRLASEGGVWFDPAITATYRSRDSLPGLARQFYRYGLSRAATVRRHPRSLSARQLAAPALVLGLLSPWRRWVALLYGGTVAGRALVELPSDPAMAAGLLLVLPVMHGSWGVGFLVGNSGLARPPGPVSGHSRGPVPVRRRSTSDGGSDSASHAFRHFPVTGS